MKQMSRIVMALLLAACMLFGSTVFSVAAEMDDVIIGSDILPESNVQSVIDFNNNQVAMKNGKLIPQTVVKNPESDGPDNIYYMDTDLYVTSDPTTGKPLVQPANANDYQYKFDMFGGNGRFYAPREVSANVPGKSADDTCLVFSYDPAKDKSEQREGNWGASDLAILTQKFVSQKIPSSASKVTYVNLAYDYVEVSFDVFFHNPQGNFLVSLENDTNNESAKFYLMIIDTEGNLYLRESSGSPSMDINSYDRKIGQLALDSWNTVTVTFYPQKGTIGYYDYWISLNGEELTRDGTTTYMSTVVDNASFLNQKTALKLTMGTGETEPTAKTYWALDNVTFESFDYLNEPDDVDTRLPQMDFALDSENVIDDFGDALAGVSAEEDGSFTLALAENAAAHLHLYKSRLPALLYDRVNNFFTLDFEVYGNHPFSMQFYGVEFVMPAEGLAADTWNKVSLQVTISEYNTILVKLNDTYINGNFTFDTEPVFSVRPHWEEGVEGEMKLQNIVLKEQVYKLTATEEIHEVDIWDSSFFSADSIINMSDKFTSVNGSPVLQFDQVSGASSRDPLFQVKGAYESEDGQFKLSLSDGGFTVKGQKVSLLLYRKNGNAYLSSDRVSDTFTVTFAVYGNPAISLSLYGQPIPVSGLAADKWNTVTVSVVKASDTEDTVSVNGIQDTALRAENPVLSILLPAGEEVQIKDIALKETVTKDVYYVSIGGQKIALSEARTNYLRYQWAKRFSANEVKAFEYGTVDRRAVRPVGDVQFDTDTYYYKNPVTIASWGSTVTPAVACDVNYWMNNKSSISEETGLETNGYLLGYTTIYMEDSAVVTQMYAQGKDGKTDLWHTSGVQFNFFKQDGVKAMDQDYVSEYFRASLSFWYDSVTFPDAGAEYRLGGENSRKDDLTDTDTLGSRYMTGQKMFRVETTDAGPRLIISTDRYGVAKPGEAGYRTEADDNYMLTQTTPSKDANGNYRTFESHVFVTNPLADALPEGESTLSVELQDGWNTLEMEFKKVHTATARDKRNNDDGSVTIFEMSHHIFEVRYIVNGDYVYHTPSDMECGNLFYFDNGLDPTSQGVYMQITAPLHSIGTEMPTELERTKYKSLKLEFLHDEEISVNSYEKGTEAEDVIRATDFVVNMEDDLRALAESEQAVEKARKALEEAQTKADIFACQNELRRVENAHSELVAAVNRRMTSVRKSGNVTFVDRNDRLLIDHLEDGSVAEVLYAFEEGEIGDVMTFDFSLYRGLLFDGSSAQTKDSTSPEVEVFVGNKVVMKIDPMGVVTTDGIVAECKASGWNNISVALEKANGIYLLTAYVNGEIVSFRIVTDVEQIPFVGVRTKGDTGDACRLDNLAVSTTNIPTSLIYMHPVTYVTGEGQMATDMGEGYHIVGDKTEVFPTVGAENALFGGWYFDEAFTSKAKLVRASYTKPVTLYAKYNYLVSYTLPDSMADSEVKPPRSTVAYGETAIPQISGVVEYWYACVNGEDIYVKGGELYNVQSNVTFEGIVKGDGKTVENADFAVAVLSIDLTDRYENIAEGVKKAEALYLLADPTHEQVVKYRNKLDTVIAEEMQAREDMARDYLALFAILEDKEKTYAERLEAYRQMDVYVYENNAEGKTFRDFVDMTVPGVFEANSDLATHSRSLERAKDACVELVLAVEGFKKAQAEGNITTMLQKFNYASLVSKAYDTCMLDLIRHAVETYDDLSLADFVDVVLRDNAEDKMKVIPTELLAGGITEYLSVAKDIIDGYNGTVEAVNGDMLGAHQVADSFTAGVYNASAEKAPAAIVALLDRFKEELEALLERS